MASLASWLGVVSSIPDSAVPLVYVATSAAIKLAMWTLANGDSLLKTGRAVLVGRVTGLSIYPVKSMDGLHQLNEAECTFTGLKLPGIDLFDRRYMVTVGEDFRFVTARQCPTLLLMKTGIENGRMYFDAPGMERLHLPVTHKTEGPPHCKATKVCGGQEVSGWDCGPEASAWFTRCLSKPDQLSKEQYRLLFNPDFELRSIDRRPHLYVNWAKPQDKIYYQDDGPYLLVTESSLTDLNRRLATGNSSPVTFDNFRPSIHIGGLTIPPYDEDTWNEIFIGDVKFTSILPCGRCVLTTLDPSNGEVRQDGEPLKTLRTYRMIQSKSPSPCFGSILVCDRPGTIHLGDQVHIIRRKEY